MSADDTDGTSEQAEYEMEEILLSEGILEEVPAGTDLRLTEEFETQWHERSRQMRSGDRALRWVATTRGVDPEDVETETEEDVFTVEIDGSVIGKWPSEVAFLAETVVRPTLREWLPESEWETLEEETRRQLSAGLLLFLERCPSCEAELVFDEEITDDAVSVSLTCPDCEATLFSGREE